MKTSEARKADEVYPSPHVESKLLEQLARLAVGRR